MDGLEARSAAWSADEFLSLWRWRMAVYSCAGLNWFIQSSDVILAVSPGLIIAMLTPVVLRFEHEELLDDNLFCFT